MTKLTHQKVRGSLKRAGLKIGHYSSDRIGRDFFYGGNVSVQSDGWYGDYDVVVKFDECSGAACVPVESRVINQSKIKAIRVLKKAFPNAKIKIEQNSLKIRGGN